MRRAYRFVAWASLLTLLIVFLALKHGEEPVLIVALMLVCAYLNVMFMAAPLKAFKQRDSKSIFIAVGTLLTNVASLYFTDFSLLTAVVVWLPAVAGILAVALLRDKRG
ncbi:hypothetical protein [Pseudoxanthomonas sp. Root630]|uniref:hypothetical protein n=1 Tax=Pseudoxanthomonas sp. Root630 TaxID=1736574 RepID=UPI000702474F|nr:hypothetical protein [Pseudoxanthomonas sp. Root630]KRA51836.1 hypothetical protein ASD72_01750 [Pseudoxanthomonas sp. Root630]